MAVAHVVGGLTVDQGRMFRSHLLECTSCRARVGELRAIAHDLADVERDERRLRTAKRTETKAHEGDDPDGPPPSTPRLGGRATLLIAAGLTILMALSAWNFVLRGRLDHMEQTVTRLRESVTVLRDGQVWETVQSGSNIDGQVSTDNQKMVIVVDGLEEARYGVYLMNAEGSLVRHAETEATNSMLYVFFGEPSIVSGAVSVVVTDLGSEELNGAPEGRTIIFKARRPDTDTNSDSEIGVHPVGEPAG
jgi:hypothetical protein